MLAVVEQVKPTVLIGTSTVAGAFNEPVVRAMASHCPRPLILPLSNPTHLAEATPEDLLRWTDGRALVATGSPFPPVATASGLRQIGQCNNCFLFPGLGYAAAALGLETITDTMIDAGLTALAKHIPASRDADAALMPALREAPAVSRAVAEAVAITGVREKLARRARTEDEALGCLDQAEWQPTYGPVFPDR